MGVRDVIAHHYFEVDPDAVFDIIKNDLDPLDAENELKLSRQALR